MSAHDLWYKETLVPSTTYRPAEGSVTEHVVFDHEPATPFLYETRASPPLAGSLYRLAMERDTCVEWRILHNHRVLEVNRLLLGHERSAAELPAGGDTTQAMAPVRFRFPSPVLPNVCWFEDVPARRLHCQLLLATGTIVRLSFLAPLLFQVPCLDAADVCLYRMQSLTGECAPVMMAGIDADTMVVGCTDGALLAVQLPKHQQQQHRAVNAHGFSTQGVMETAFNPESLLAQMLVVPARMLSQAFKRSGSMSNAQDDIDGMPVYEASSTPEQVISLATYATRDDTLIFGICRDGHLRAWSLLRRKCIWSRPLQQHEPNPLENSRIAATAPHTLLPEQPRKCIWPLRPPTASTGHTHESAFHLLVYVPNDQEQVFTILRGQLDPSGHLDQLVKVYTHPSPWASSVMHGGYDAFSLLDTACEHIDHAGPRAAGHTVRLWTLWQQRQQQMEIRFTFLTLPLIAGAIYEVQYHSTTTTTTTTAAAGEDQEMLESTTLTTTIQGEPKNAVGDYRALYGERWFSVATDASDLFDLTQLNSMVEAQPEAVSQLYLQHIFFPNRFSRVIIEKALDRYESGPSAERRPIGGSPPGQHPQADEALLVERVTNAVSRRLTLPVYEPTGAVLLDEFSEMVKKEWYRFLTICSQLRETTRQPMGLFVDASLGMVCTVRKSALSLLRRCSETELLWHHVDEQYDLAALSFLPATTFAAHFPSLSRQSDREDMACLLEAIMTLQEDMGDEVLRYVEEELRVLLITTTHEPLEVAGLDIYDIVRDKLSAHAQYRLFGLLRSCRRLPETIARLLVVIRGQSTSTMDILPQQRAARLIESGVVMALGQRISIAYQLSIRLILLVLISLLDPELKELPRLEPTLVARCVQTLRYNTMLKRVCDVSSASQVNAAHLHHRRHVDGGVKSSMAHASLREDDFIKYFTKLHVSDTAEAAMHGADRLRHHSTVHQLVHRFYRVRLQSASLSEAITVGAEHIQSQLPGANSAAKTNMLEDENELEGARLAAHLLALDLSHVSYQSLQLLSSTPIVCHLRGMIHLRHDEYEKARDNFIKAGVQLEAPVPEANSSIALFNSVLVEPSNVTALFGADAARTAAPGTTTHSVVDGYYAYVADLFEKQAHYEYAAEFYQLALKFQPASNANETAQLYSQLFKCYLALQQYDDAFMAMMQNTDPIKQSTCLSQFVIKLCDKQQIGKLCSYAFGALQSEVEATLEFRARTCGVLSTPRLAGVCLAQW